MKKVKNSDSLRDHRKIYICTPSFNSADTIEDTILSVINQEGKFEIFYHIQDGGSNDSTLSILKEYQNKIKMRTSVNPKIYFSFDSSKDNGMYYAIVKGFSTFNMASNNWMTWINSDDQLALDALNFICSLSDNSDNNDVQWVGGRTSVMKENGDHTEFFLKANSEIINFGLNDGLHWGFLQQEGVFFRNSLWNIIDKQKNLTDFKYAGDWNLWRAFSEHEKLYQVDRVLGTFYKRKGQISEVSKAEYMLEIEAYVSKAERYKNFRALSDIEHVHYEISDDNNFSKIEKSINGAIQYWQKRREEEGLTEQSACTLISKNIIAFDSQWQFPAITEQYAFSQMQGLLNKTNTDAIYFAFPWATLIDLLNMQRPRGQVLLCALRTFKELLKDKKIITVCQHILMLKFQYLFDEIGVTDIYWTHAIHNQTSLVDFPNVKIYPFPLYPVQAIGLNDEKNILDRKYLFSFVGAKPNEWYLTESRSMIIDLLKDSPRGKVIARNTWHYQNAVYEHQIDKNVAAGSELIDKDTTAEFKNILRESIFALCPSGTGPNSIRLWESIGYGVIPVILADTYLPPGNRLLWDEAAVFCKEDADSIKALPGVLSEIAKDKSLLQRKRNALKQLWLIYGPDCFVYDILKRFIQDVEKRLVRTHSLLSCKELIALHENNESFQELLLLSCTSKLLLDHNSFLNEIHSCEKSAQYLKEAITKNSKYLDVFNKVQSFKNIDLSFN